MYEKINNHEERIVVLEKTDVEILKRIKEVENNYVNLENTILKGNQSTQDFFRDLTNKQWDLITERDKSKDAERERAHQLAVGNQDIKKSNWERGWELLGKATLTGGFIYLLVEQFLMK